MKTIQTLQPTEQTSTLQDILDIQLKICQSLNIQITEINLQPPSFDLKTLNIFKVILRKIYNRILKTSTPKNFNLDITNTFQSTQQKQAYQQIEDLLQKEESRNRVMLKKEFEYKEYMNTVIEQLNDQKKINRKLNNQFSKLNEDREEKTLQILHLKNQTKAFQRANKDLGQDKSETKSKNAYYISSISQLDGYQILKDDKKIHTARQRQYSKSQTKKNKDAKQKAIYALYNHHKKNFDANNAISSAEKTKKGSLTQRQTGRKSAFKEINSIEFPNKKSIKFRRKSEECCKRTPSKKEGKQLRQAKKKKDEIIGRFNLV